MKTKNHKSFRFDCDDGTYIEVNKVEIEDMGRTMERLSIIRGLDNEHGEEVWSKYLNLTISKEAREWLAKTIKEA